MRRWIALTLAVLTALGAVLALRVHAAGEVTFTVINDVFVPSVTDDTMPLRRNGQSYVPYSVLLRLITVKVHNNKTLQRLLVYDFDHTLTFDLASGMAYDDAGTLYEPNAIRHNGTIYVPVSVICRVFGFTSSYITSSPIGNIVRISSEEITVPDEVLAVRAAERMQQLYDDYLASKKEPEEPVPPVDPEPENPNDEQKVPKLVFLEFEGALNDATERILDILSVRGYTASFFVSEADTPKEDTLRRVFAEGHTIGIFASKEKAASADMMRESIERTSDAVRGVLHTRPRLLCVPDVAELDTAQRDALIADGYRIWEANADPYADDRTATGIRLNVERLLQRMTRSAVIRLTSNDAVAEALPGILDYLKNEGATVLAIREWDTPINGAREVR